MKKYDSGEALAKAMGLDPKVLSKTFEDYNVSIRTKKDPFGKKVHFQLACFHRAFLTPSLVFPIR